MPHYYPIYIRRSDGKLQIQRTKNTVEPNEPTSDQLDQKPNNQGVSDFYRQCQHGESKELDWRRKLGGMLIRLVGNSENHGEIDWPPQGIQFTVDPYQERNYILAELPENYRLYEHVKCKLTNVDGKLNSVTKTKTHAAGGNERQDAYLYGYPEGRKKRYRSPAEFFPHLLWLVTDEKGDPNNCTCKFCSPEELHAAEKPTPKPQIRDTKPELNKLNTANGVMKAPMKQGKATTSPGPRTAQSPLSTTLEPSPLPRFRSPEQKLDASPKGFLHRSGETVWFSKGNAWGLGVIVRRDQTQHLYRVQPLSHPYQHPAVIICKHEDLRPWLAWSAPPCTCIELNSTDAQEEKKYHFDNVDWHAFLKGRYGDGDAEVDASILAACAVEKTFTPFDITEQTAYGVHYNGIWIGGEKLWIGDPLRMRNSNFVTDMMVLHDIIEQRTNNSKKPHIVLVGDIYSYRVKQLEGNHMPKSDLHLPHRVREDLNFRNSVTAATKDPVTFFWRLCMKGARLSIGDVRGRWFESGRLLPLLDPQFREKCLRAEVHDPTEYMNGQGDCNKSVTSKSNINKALTRPADTKIARREEAFSRSVPPLFKISRGLDEPKEAKPQPQGPGGPEMKREPSAGGRDILTASYNSNARPSSVQNNGIVGGKTESQGGRPDGSQNQSNSNAEQLQARAQQYRQPYEQQQATQAQRNSQQPPQQRQQQPSSSFFQSQQNQQQPFPPSQQQVAHRQQNNQYQAQPQQRQQQQHQQPQQAQSNPQQPHYQQPQQPQSNAQQQTGFDQYFNFDKGGENPGIRSGNNNQDVRADHMEIDSQGGGNQYGGSGQFPGFGQNYGSQEMS